MRTELLYQTDSYARSFDGRVVDVTDHGVVLDRSLFYPRGGGQMADHGTLEAYRERFRVIAVEKRGDEVLHTVERSASSAGCAPVRGTIDWEHRYRMMRTQTALHVLCGVIFQGCRGGVTGNRCIRIELVWISRWRT